MVIGVGVSTCRIGDLVTVPEGGLIYTIPGPDQGADSVLNGAAAVGSTAPQVMKIYVGHTGKGQLDWNAKVGGGSAWLTIANKTGTAGDSIVVVGHPDPLTLGSHRDSIVVTSSTGGVVVVPVDFQIVPCSQTSIPSSGGAISDTLNSADCGAPHRPRMQAQLFEFNGHAGDLATVLLTAGFNGFVALDTSLTAPPLDSTSQCLGNPTDPCLYYKMLPRDATYIIEVSSATAADSGVFTVQLIQGGRNPNRVDSLDQRLPDSTTSVAIGATVGNTVLVRAVVGDFDVVDSLRLQVEYQPLGTPFTMTGPFGPYAKNGTAAWVSLGPLSDQVAYHWQVRSQDQTGRFSPWDSLPRGGSPDFTPQLGHNPDPPKILQQLQSNGTTVIAVGDTATSTTVKFRAQVTDQDAGDVLRLEVEAEPIGTDTTGTPSANQTFTTASSGGTSTATIISLVDGTDYHWFARTRDQTNRVSAWVPFGNNLETETDFHVKVKPAFNLVFTVPPSQTAAGVAMTPAVQVTAQDAFGQTITTFTGNVTMTVAGPAGFSTAADTTVAAVAGVATFSNLIINVAGSYTFQAKSGFTLSQPTSSFAIVAGPAKRLVFSAGPPASTVAGSPITPLTVTARDSLGNTANFGNPVSLAITTGTGKAGANLRGTTTVTASGGNATFTTVNIDSAGISYTLTASATGLIGATSTAFNIIAGTATQIAFAVQPSTTTASSPITPTVQVAARDALGNTATSFTGNVTLTFANNAGGGTLSGGGPFAASSGVATFPTLSIDKKGTGYTLSASATGFTSVTSAAFDIVVSNVDPNNSSANATSPITVCNTGCSPGAGTQSVITDTVRDGSGNPISGATVSLSASPSTGVTITQPGPTDVNGVTTGTLTSTDSGTITVTAVANGVTIADHPSITLLPGPAASLTFTAQPSATTAGAAINSGSGVVVTARDQFGNVAAGFNGTVTMTIAAGPPGGAFAPTSTNSVTAVSGVARFLNLRIYKAGTGYQIRASSGALNTTSTPFDINAGAANQLAFSVQPANPSTVLAKIDSAIGGVVVNVEDSVGNTVPFPGTVRIVLGTDPAGGSTLSGGAAIPAPSGIATFPNLTLNKLGTGFTILTLSASPALISDESTLFNIVAGPAAKLVFSNQPTATVAGARIDSTSGGVKVTAQDANGFTATSFTGNVAMSITAGTGTSGAVLGGTTTQPAISGTATFPNLTINLSGSAYTLTAAAGGTVTSAISNSFDIVPGGPSASQSTVGPAPGSIVACKTGCTVPSTASTITVTVKDAVGNPIQGATVTLSSDGVGDAITQPSSPTSSSGVTSGQISDTVVETVHVSATVNGSVLITQTATVSVTPAAAAALLFIRQPTTTTAGATITPSTGVQVQVNDQFGNKQTSAANSIDLVILVPPSPGGATLGGTHPKNAVNGVATFSDLRIDKTGNNYELRAQATGLTSDTSSAFNITPGTATKLAFVQNPTSTTGGATITPAVTVEIEDAAGNRVTSANSNVTVAIGTNPNSGTLSGLKTVAATSGLATFSNLSIDSTGTGYTLAASATGLTGATSFAFNISVGAAAKLGFRVQPSNTAGGASITPAVAVEVEDAGGNRVTSAINNITVAIGTNPNNGTLGGLKTVAAASGLATFSNLSIDSAGTGYTLTASATGLTGTASSGFNITVGPAAKLGFHVQPSTTAGGAAITPAVQVEIQDLGGNRVTTANNTISVSIGTNPSGGTLSGNAPVSASSGIAIFSNLSIDKVGNGYTLAAAATGLTGATSASFNITTGSGVKLAFVQQPTQTAGGATITPAVTVEVEDAGGNRVTSAINSITVAISTNPNNGTLGGLKTVAATNGLATFSNLSIDSAGTGYTLTASASGLTGATSSPFNITVGAASRLGFLVQPQSTTGGATITPAVQVEIRDAGGNRVTSANNSITVAIGTNPNSGTLGGTKTQAAVAGVASFSTLSIDSAGTGYTLAASATGLTGATSFAFNISVGAAAKLGFRVQPGNSTGGTAIPSFQVEVRDAGGNRVTSATTSIQLTLNGGDAAASLSGTNPQAANAGLATFSDIAVDSAANTYTLVATGGGLNQATSLPFNITVGPAAKLGFHVQPSNTVAGVSIFPQVQVELQDAGGNRVATNGTTITVAIAFNAGGGTLSGNTSRNTSSGLATYNNISINKVGNGYTLQATSGGLTGATSSSFDITPAAADHLTFVVQPSTTLAGQTITPAVVVEVRDVFENRVTSATTAITVAIGTNPGTPTPGTLTGTLTVNAVSGQATFSDLKIDNPGLGYTLTASAASLTGDTSVSFDIL